MIGATEMAGLMEVTGLLSTAGRILIRESAQSVKGQEQSETSSGVQHRVYWERLRLLKMWNALVGHLVGDYLIQNDWMALNKKQSSLHCAVHCGLWTLSVILFAGWPI